MTLVPYSNLRAAEWVSRDLPEVPQWGSEQWQGVFVSHCLPAGFASYCKLFHPIYVDQDAPGSTESWASTDGDPEHSLGKLVSVGAGVDPTGSRVLWESLATGHGLVFHAEMTAASLRRGCKDESMPRRLLGPDEGSLDRPTCTALLDILKLHVPGERCFFYYDLIATRSLEAPLLYEGELDELLATLSLEEVDGSPTYWWPESRSWCICTDWDLTFTLVGGPENLVHGILRSADLEALMVSRTTRVDDRADRINVNTTD